MLRRKRRSLEDRSPVTPGIAEYFRTGRGFCDSPLFWQDLMDDGATFRALWESLTEREREAVMRGGYGEGPEFTDAVRK